MSSASTLQVRTGIYMYILSHFSPSFFKKKKRGRKKTLLASLQRVGTKQKKRAYYSYTQEAQGKELKRLAAPLHPSSFFEARALQHRVANTEDGPHFRSSKNKKEHIYVLLPFFLQLTSAKKREGHSCLQKPPP